MGIIVAILVLSLVIIIHELGHFLAARRAGILCHEFSLGMGPILWSKRKGETLYCVRAIPLGGYVAMAGEEVEDEMVKPDQQIRIVTEGNVIVKIILDHADPQYEEYELVTVNQVDLKGVEGNRLHINNMEVKRDAFYVIKKREIQIAPADRNFNYKSKRQRFLAIFGGPFMNFVLAFFVFILFAFIQGFPNTDSSVIGEVSENSPAYGILEPGDKIVYINGDSTNGKWMSEGTEDSVSRVLDLLIAERELILVVNRDGENVTLPPITPVIYFYSVGFRTADEGSVDALVVGPVAEGTQAADAGMQEGDLIISVDGVDVTTWQEVIDNIPVVTESYYDDADEFTFDILVERDGSTTLLTIKDPWTANVLDNQGVPLVDSVVGISPEYSFHFGKSLGYGFTAIGNSIGLISDTLSLLFGSSQVGAGDLAGPVGILQISSAAYQDGFVSLLAWVGLLSVNLGFINLLPIPALDGGRLVFLGIEAVGLKVNTKWENRVHYIMYLMLLGFFVFITYNDIVRLIERIF